MKVTINLLFLTVMILSSGCGSVRFFIPERQPVTINRGNFKDLNSIVNGDPVVFTPAASPNMNEEDILLAEYAPILIQGTLSVADNKYPKDSDLIGQPVLHRNGKNNFRVTVDTDKPRMFSSVEKAHVKGMSLTQLVYVYWYPRHPVGTIEKGNVDGGVLRITLDASNRPAVYEHSAICGCFHTTYISDYVENLTKSEFSERGKNKRYYVEKNIPGHDDIVVKTIVGDLPPGMRPVLFLEAGTHLCLAIEPEKIFHHDNAYLKKEYTIHPYSSLYHLPIVDEPYKFGSMFNLDGLVWGGRRIGEELVFSNIDHPGWPKRLDKIKIHWDKIAWDDPTFLDHYLRLPKTLVVDRKAKDINIEDTLETKGATEVIQKLSTIFSAQPKKITCTLAGTPYMYPD